MARHGVLVIGLVVLLVLGSGGTPTAYAQVKGEGIFHRVELQYWSAAGTGPTTSWTTGFIGLQYSGVTLSSPFGLRAQYLSGTSSLAQPESFWEIALTYRLAFAFRGADVMSSTAAQPAPLGRGPMLVRATVGYGSLSWNAAGGAATSKGFGVGTEATMIVRSTASGGTLALVGDFTWFPSNSATGPLGSGSGTTSIWSIGIRYKSPSKMAGPTTDSVYAGTPNAGDVQGREWDYDVGLRSANAGITVGSTYTWSGFYLAIGKTF